MGIRKGYTVISELYQGLRKCYPGGVVLVSGSGVQLFVIAIWFLGSINLTRALVSKRCC